MPSGDALNINVAVGIERPDIRIGVERKWKNVEFEVSKGGAYYPEYDGPYVVDPSFYFDKKLGTYGKAMTDDVTVNHVPVFEASNPQGGKTITIGVI